MYKKIKRWYQDKIGIGENRDKLFYLEKRIKLNHALIQLLLPESLEFDVANRPLPFYKNAGATADVCYTLHKNDLMFLGVLFSHNGVLNSALNEYFSVGYETAKQLQALAERHKITSFLDFGAGYGRVSRFLPALFPDAAIHVSDIKEESVLYSQKTLKLNGEFHGTDASKTKFSQPFDFIFAGSVFTHLPENMCTAWLDVLCAHINPNGLLVFSIHNPKTFGIKTTHGFHYHEDSEDAFFSWVDDSIKDTATYGTSYTSHTLINQWMVERGFTCSFKPNAFGGTQDLVVATKTN